MAISEKSLSEGTLTRQEKVPFQELLAGEGQWYQLFNLNCFQWGIKSCNKEEWSNKLIR